MTKTTLASHRFNLSPSIFRRWSQIKSPRQILSLHLCIGRCILFPLINFINPNALQLDRLTFAPSLNVRWNRIITYMNNKNQNDKLDEDVYDYTKFPRILVKEVP